MKNNKYNFNRKAPIRISYCSCGSPVKKLVRKNYPYGRNAKCRKITVNLCLACGKKQ